jgi:hypothetical protein
MKVISLVLPVHRRRENVKDSAEITVMPTTTWLTVWCGIGLLLIV